MLGSGIKIRVYRKLAGRLIGDLGIQVGANSYTLNPGTYTAVITVTNTSTQNGTPIAATLTVKAAAIAGSVSILPATSQSYPFSAQESHNFSFPFTVPDTAGGQSGTISAILLDPSGNQLASASAAIVINSPYDFIVTGSFNQLGATIKVTNNKLQIASNWVENLEVISATLHDDQGRLTEINTGGMIPFTLPQLGQSVTVQIPFNQTSLGILINDGKIASNFSEVTIVIGSYTQNPAMPYSVYTGDGSPFFIVGSVDMWSNNPPPLPTLYRA